MTDHQHACDDDGLAVPGAPAADEPTDPAPSNADFDYEAPGFEPWPEGD